MGYIYVIKNEVGGLGGFKIGKTIDPLRRFKELKIGTKASLVGLWCSAAYSSIEKQLHTTYKQFRVPQSEWFALTSNTLIQVISKLNRIAEQVTLSDDYKSSETAVVSTPVPQTYTKPAVTTTTTTYQTTPGTDTSNFTAFLGGIFCGLMPGFNLFFSLLCFVMVFDKKQFRPGDASSDAAKFGMWTTIVTTALFYFVVSSANAKPLTNYQFEPAQNVSSLIK